MEEGPILDRYCDIDAYQAKMKHAQLVEDIHNALEDAAWRMKYDPNKPAEELKHVYPSEGKGKWIGRSMQMWRLKGAHRPLYIGYDACLYYCHNAETPKAYLLPAEFEKRNIGGLEHLLRLIQAM